MLWALLPTVADPVLGLPAAGYGMLLGALGTGAVAGSIVLSRLRARLSTNTIVASGAAVVGVSTAMVVLPVPLPVVVGALVCGGAGWIGAVATAGGAIQAHLPVWVRTRALSLYELVLFGSLGLAAILRPIRDLDETVARAASLPIIEYPTAALDDDHEVVVAISHAVPPAMRDAFLRDIRDVERARRRTGARHWRLLDSLDRPDVLVEVFVIGS